MEELNNAEVIEKSVVEFSRLQSWMALAEKGSAVYEEMHKRYIELKVIISSLGVNITEIDTIKD